MRIDASLLCALLAASGLLNAAEATSEPVQAFAPISVQIAGSLKNHGITVLGSNSPGFASVLAGTLGAGTSQSLAPLHNYMLLISNGSGQTITSMRVRYTRVVKTGRVTYTDLPYGSSDLYPQYGLKAGASVVAAPGMNIMRIVRQLPASRNYIFQSADFDGLAPELSADIYRSVALSVDSLILEDGTVLGPDTWGVIDDHQAKLQILPEILFQVRDPNTSDAALQSWLTSKTNQNFFTGGVFNHYVYNDVNLANLTRGAIKLNGRAYTVTLLESMLRHAQGIVLRRED